MIDVLSQFLRASAAHHRRRTISRRVMPAKDGRYAPSLLRDMSNDAELVLMFPIRKSRAVRAFAGRMQARGNSLPDAVLRDGDAGQLSSLRRIFRAPKPNSIKLLDQATRRKMHAAILFASELSPLSSSAKARCA